MSKFKIGDEVSFKNSLSHHKGIVKSFDTDGDPHVKWTTINAECEGDYYDSQLVLYDPDSWSDFKERIKERIV